MNNPGKNEVGPMAYVPVSTGWTPAVTYLHSSARGL